ncbi:hypothetical protein ACFOQM_01465 [Paenibacillus sp. GCM10012307]|uniref:hypothetical protein n=1 Tax=Paenibacillus sp. GCM10012307 TaxID=3317343 RepID=UPI003621F0FC
MFIIKITSNTLIVRQRMAGCPGIHLVQEPACDIAAATGLTGLHANLNLYAAV